MMNSTVQRHHLWGSKNSHKSGRLINSLLLDRVYRTTNLFTYVIVNLFSCESKSNLVICRAHYYGKNHCYGAQIWADIMPSCKASPPFGWYLLRLPSWSSDSCWEHTCLLITAVFRVHHKSTLTLYLSTETCPGWRLWMVNSTALRSGQGALTNNGRDAWALRRSAVGSGAPQGG